MPTVTFLVGLCGAGKTWYVERIQADRKFDEGFLDEANKAKNIAELIETLQSGKDAVVSEIGYCFDVNRQAIVKDLAVVRDLTIRWMCIENDLQKANRNCRERKGHNGDPELLAKINARLSEGYSCPGGAIRLPMWPFEQAAS